MERHDFANYKSGTFATDITNLELADRFFEPKDIPAFVHEYCHYIQDITTISSVFGFYLWLRDVVALTRVFSDGEGKTISIPLDRDIHGETINKFRKYYNLYCGDPDAVYDIDYTNAELIKNHQRVETVPLDGNIQKLAVNEIEISNHANKLHFGLIALQEIHAYYAQKLAEKKTHPTVELSSKADDLPSYPYRFGDFLFDQYNIEIDLETKFILIDLCLDTVQSTSVFLNVLEKNKGQRITYFGKDSTNIISIVEQCREQCSYSNIDALEQIIPDLENWSKGPGRKYLTEALDWYLKQLKSIYGLKRTYSPTFFSTAFTMNWENFASFFQSFPSPVYLKDNTLYRTVSANPDLEEDNEFIRNYEAATTIWSHRLIYDLLC